MISVLLKLLHIRIEEKVVQSLFSITACGLSHRENIWCRDVLSMRQLSLQKFF